MESLYPKKGILFQILIMELLVSVEVHQSSDEGLSLSDQSEPSRSGSDLYQTDKSLMCKNCHAPLEVVVDQNSLQESIDEGFYYDMDDKKERVPQHADSSDSNYPAADSDMESIIPPPPSYSNLKQMRKPRAQRQASSHPDSSTDSEPDTYAATDSSECPNDHSFEHHDYEECNLPSESEHEQQEEDDTEGPDELGKGEEDELAAGGEEGLGCEPSNIEAMQGKMSPG